MFGKKKVLEFLNLKTMGKRENKLFINVGDFAPLEVKRINGDMGFVVGKYNNETNTYDVHYDPNCSDGVIRDIICSFKPIEKKGKKEKIEGSDSSETKEGNENPDTDGANSETTEG